MVKIIKNKIAYESDINNSEGKAALVAIPENIQEIQSLVLSHGQADIIVRGAGTSFVKAVMPDNSLIIDLSCMNSLLKINPARKTAHIQTGVTIEQLNNELEKSDLEFPVEPLFPEIQTIGGLMALNCPGDRELKYGPIINWVDSLEIITDRGEVRELSKSEATDFVGLEGTTGVMVSAKLRLISKKQRTISILRSTVLEDLLQISKKLKLNLEVSMILLIGKKLASMSGLENKYHLLVEFESNRGTMKNQEYDDIMRMKKSFYQKMASQGFTLPENPKFFSESLRDMILFLEHRDLPFYANTGSGSIFTCFKPEDIVSRQECRELTKKMRGSISHSFGIGLLNKEFIEKNDREIIKRIKQRHDPNYIFNRGKVIDSTKQFLEKPTIVQSEKISERAGEKISEESIEKIEIKTKELIEKQKKEPVKEQKEEKQESNDKPEQTSIQVSAIILKKRDEVEMSAEEKEKIKKIAGGFFGKI